MPFATSALATVKRGLREAMQPQCRQNHDHSASSIELQKVGGFNATGILANDRLTVSIKWERGQPTIWPIRLIQQRHKSLWHRESRSDNVIDPIV